MTQTPSGGWPPPGQNSSGSTAQGGQRPSYGAPGSRPHRLGDPTSGQRDPNAPLGGHVPPSASIDQYQAPRSRMPLIVTLVVLALVAVGVAAAVWWSNRPVEEPTATPSTSSPLPGSQITGNGVPFVNQHDQSRGIWEIVEHRWTSRGLELDVRLSVSEGEAVTDFFALDNDSTVTYEADLDAADALQRQWVQAGQTVTGLVVFDKPHADTTIFLADSSGRQVTALVVPA